MGFAPMYGGFADHCVKLLRHGTIHIILPIQPTPSKQIPRAWPGVLNVLFVKSQNVFAFDFCFC